MNVYLLWALREDGDDLIGVYSSRARAERAADEVSGIQEVEIEEVQVE